MRPEQASLWYRRMSVVYAMGAWSLLGSVIFFTRKASGDGVEQMDGSRNETPVSASDISDLERGISEPVEGLCMKAYVQSSENCVPVTQRILDYLKSWTGGPGPGP